MKHFLIFVMVMLQRLVLLVLILGGGLIIFIQGSIKPPELYGDTSEDVSYSYAPPSIGEEAIVCVEDIEATSGAIKLNPTDEVFDNRKPYFYTFLLVGTDHVGGNTDTIMVASFDAVRKEAHIVSIPRDTCINVSRKVKKINAAYSVGGIEQLKAEVKTVVGFVPDYYIVVSLDTFTQLVDAIGGVEVDVPMRMKYSDAEQNLYIDLRAGKQLLNGEDALGFARYRTGSAVSQGISDYQRIENQQQVIRAAAEQTMKPMNLLKLPEFIQIFLHTVTTDLSTGNLFWFAQQLNGIRNTDTLYMHTVPVAGSLRTDVWYTTLDEEAVVELVNATINPYLEDITTFDVDIVSD